MGCLNIQVKRVGEGLQASCHRIGEGLQAQCSLLCAVPNYLTVSPNEVQWVMIDSPVVYDVKTRFGWKVE